MKNKILITGSSSGIGLSIGHVFSERDWKVCFTSRNKQKLIKLSEKFVEEKHMFQNVDFINPNEVKNLYTSISQKWGGLDSIIINVGSGTGEKSITSSFKENYRIVQTNYRTAYLSAKILYPLLLQSKNPSITFIGSIAANVNVGAPLSYSMSKRAIENLSNYLSVNLSSFSIRVNCVHAGHTLTRGGFWENFKDKDPNLFEEFIRMKTLTGDILDPIEIGYLVYDLTNSNYSKKFTGSVLRFDSGTTWTK